MAEQGDRKIVISHVDLGSSPPTSSTATKGSVSVLTAPNVLLLVAVAVTFAGLLGAAVWTSRAERADALAAGTGEQPTLAAIEGPASVCLVIDRSGSMAGTPLADAKAAARDFVSYLKATDEVAVVDFGSDVHVALERQQVGDQESAVLQAIDEIPCDGMTALWDAGIEAVDLLSKSEPNRTRMVILLSDGMNNASGNTVETLVDRARQSNVIVHTVALGLMADRDTLKRVADETNGAYNQAKSSKQLRGIYQNLGRSLRK